MEAVDESRARRLQDRGVDDRPHGADRQRGEVGQGSREREEIASSFELRASSMWRIAVAALAWGAVAAAAAGWHPALREGAPLAGLGRQIAEDTAQGGALLGKLGLAGNHVPVAFWLLDLSLLYIAGWGLFALCPPRGGPARGVSLPILVAALAGQAAACFARTPTAVHFIAAGVAALAFRPGPAPENPAPGGRLVMASLVGLVFVLLAWPLDGGLASLTGAGFLPEAWFPLYVEFDT